MTFVQKTRAFTLMKLTPSHRYRDSKHRQASNFLNHGRDLHYYPVVASEIDAGGRACRYKHSLKTTFLTTGVNFINILCTRFLCESKLSSFYLITFGFAIFWHQNIGKKVLSKMLMKLTPGVNFTNILWAALAHIDPKSEKIHWWLDYLSAPWGSAQIKAVSKHDVEIDLRCQFHQHFTSRFYVRKCFSLLSSHHSLAL